MPKLARLISNISQDIAKRLDELERNPLNLPDTCPGAPRRDTQEGHREIIQELQEKLAEYQAEYARLCTAPEPEPEPNPEPNPQPNPQPNSNFTPVIVIIGVGIGIGIGIIFAPEITIPVLVLSPAGV